MLNVAQFTGSGGWVLKPEGYRGSATGREAITHESQVDAMPYKKLNFSVEILAAQDLPSKGISRFEKLHPYAKIVQDDEIDAKVPQVRQMRAARRKVRRKDGSADREQWQSERRGAQAQDEER